MKSSFKSNESKLHATILGMKKEIDELQKMQKVAVKISAEEKEASEAAIKSLEQRLSKAEDHGALLRKDNIDLKRGLEASLKKGKELLGAIESSKESLIAEKKSNLDAIQEIRTKHAAAMETAKTEFEAQLSAIRTELSDSKAVIISIEEKLESSRTDE